jgi:hypothetical protein
MNTQTGQHNGNKKVFQNDPLDYSRKVRLAQLKNRALRCILPECVHSASLLGLRLWMTTFGSKRWNRKAQGNAPFDRQRFLNAN